MTLEPNKLLHSFVSICFQQNLHQFQDSHSAVQRSTNHSHTKNWTNQAPFSTIFTQNLEPHAHKTCVNWHRPLEEDEVEVVVVFRENVADDSRWVSVANLVTWQHKIDAFREVPQLSCHVFSERSAEQTHTTNQLSKIKKHTLTNNFNSHATPQHLCPVHNFILRQLTTDINGQKLLGVVVATPAALSTAP